MENIHILDADAPVFPATSCALSEPNGLLAVGGNLESATLVDAYSRGIFPWFDDEQPILWWSPNPRMMMTPSDVRISRSMAKLARRKPFTITVDTEFASVISNCSQTARPDQQGTWITDDMYEAYLKLHHLGYAHSIETWQDNELVGGLYGVAIGGAFFGESMFARASGASKHAFVSLCQQLSKWQFTMVDCQVHTAHLQSMGALEVARELFESKLREAMQVKEVGDWQGMWQLSHHGYLGDTLAI